MEISLIIKEKNKSLNIPITKEEIRTVYDKLYHNISYYNENRKKLKKYQKEGYKNLIEFHNKLMFLVHDVIDKGKVYRIEGKKSILEKKPHYIVKKPKWN